MTENCAAAVVQPLGYRKGGTSLSRSLSLALSLSLSLSLSRARSLSLFRVLRSFIHSLFNAGNVGGPLPSLEGKLQDTDDYKCQDVYPATKEAFEKQVSFKGEFDPSKV